VQRRLVDDRAAAGIDQDRRLLHHPELARADEVAGALVERHVQADDVRRL